MDALDMQDMNKPTNSHLYDTDIHIHHLHAFLLPEASLV